MNKHNTDFLIPNLYSAGSILNENNNDMTPHKYKKLQFVRERGKMLTGNIGMFTNNNESFKFRNIIQNINFGNIDYSEDTIFK